MRACVRACVCDEMSVSLCLCKRSGLLRDGTSNNLLLLLRRLGLLQLRAINMGHGVERTLWAFPNV